MSQDVKIKDIFQGAEKIEILGKLPSYLWAYIDASHKMINELSDNSESHERLLPNFEKLLTLLHYAAEHVENQELQSALSEHRDLMDKLKSGSIQVNEFSRSLEFAVGSIEKMAGQRTEIPENLLDSAGIDRELIKTERVKSGRSADIIVSMDLLSEIRDFLQQEVISEGISTVLVIDNAGTLIVNIGHKVDLDVIGLAAVAAANFAATEQIAKLIGEKDFVLLFYKGHLESFHFSRVGSEYIIVTIFDNSLSLGLLRLKIAEVSQVLEQKLPKRQG